MPVKLLDPTLDVVFKLLLLRRQELLRDMIEAVLGLSEPIFELEVLNPEIPKDTPADKGVVLDIRIRLNNGHQIDLEMQSSVAPGTRARFLYYWARNFASSLELGDDYTLLRPCISVLWFKEPLLKGTRFHSVFHLTEDQTREPFTHEIEFHVLELPKFHLAQADLRAKLVHWARFLRATTPEELEDLANEDAIMTTAKETLLELSSDPVAQRLAQERQTAVLVHRHLLNSSREEGLAEGFAIGEAKGIAIGEAKGIAIGEAKGIAIGEAKGLIEAIQVLCEVLEIPLSETQSHRMATLSCGQLTELLQRLKAERQWPDAF